MYLVVYVLVGEIYLSGFSCYHGHQDKKWKEILNIRVVIRARCEGKSSKCSGTAARKGMFGTQDDIQKMAAYMFWKLFLSHD